MQPGVPHHAIALCRGSKKNTKMQRRRQIVRMIVTTIGHISELPKALETAIRMHAHGTTLDGRGEELPTVLVTLVGCPASGKSTVRAAITRLHMLGLICETICPDDIRMRMTGDATDQSANVAVWRYAIERLGTLLSMHGVMVIFDATASHVRDRRRLATEAHVHDAIAIEIWCDTPLEQCYERNDARERHVPRDVIRRMHSSISMNPPTGDQFADAVIVIRTR